MWQTPLGIRRLLGPEAWLVQWAAARMCAVLENSDEPFQCGAPAFDGLDPHRQRLAIATVARSHTDKHPPLPPQAWEDAAVFALFEFVHREVAAEIGMSGGPDPCRWRGLVRDALAQVLADHPGCVPRHDSTDLRQWDFDMMYLADRILLNHDFFEEDPAAEPPCWTLFQEQALIEFLTNIVFGVDRQVA